MGTPIFGITEVNLDHGGARSTAHGSSGITTGTRHASMLSEKVEDATLEFDKNSYTPLPETVNMELILENVLKSMPFTSGKSRLIWRNHLKSETCRNMVKDIFWWTLSHLGLLKAQAQETQDAAENFVSRISDNYIRLFYQLPSAHKDQFFGRFYDSLAQIIFQAYSSAFRGSLQLFDDDFKLKLVDTFAEWTTGLVPSHPSWLHWAQQVDVKGGKGRSNQLATLGRKGMASKMNSSNQASTQRWNRAVQSGHTLCYSPFVTKFLSNDRHRKALAFRITLTQDPSRPISLSTTGKNRTEGKVVQTRSDIIAGTKQRRNEILREYQAAREQTLREITTIRKEISEEQALLGKKRKEVFKGDVHEYSNYLVSLWSTQDDSQPF